MPIWRNRLNWDRLIILAAHHILPMTNPEREKSLIWLSDVFVGASRRAGIPEHETAENVRRLVWRICGEVAYLHDRGIAGHA
jgi:hypothetical protein